jgi:signal transduction histidine kinase
MSAQSRSMFWLFQLGGWMLFWGTMVVAGLSQWAMGFTLAHKTFLAVPGFTLSLLLREIFRFAARRAVPVPVLVAASLPLSWAGAAVWMAIHNLLLGIYMGTPSAWSRFPDFNNAMYYAVVLLAWCLLYFGIQIYLAHQRDRERLAAAESLAQAARLRALRLQLDPHFLFNSLNGISTLIAEGRNGEADAMLGRLGDFLRMTLEAPEASEVPLKTEIEFTRRYLEIERARFGERLRVDIDVADATANALVPVMILQPLVENAVRHAVQLRPGGGSIVIASARDERWLTLRVDDDGPGLDAAAQKRIGIGIANTRDRLEQLYGAECEMRFDRGVLGGLSVFLRFPFRAAGAEA